MSLTGNFLDTVEPFIGSWSRSSGQLSALKLTEQGQDELFDCDAPGLIWYGTENGGFPPYLTTTAAPNLTDSREYQIVAGNLTGVSSITKTINGTAYAVRARYVRRVFVDVAKSVSFAYRFSGEPSVFSYNNPFRLNNDRVEIAEIPVDSEPCREGDAAMIRFKGDPGATTDVFFVEFFWEPMRLTAETIPLCVPSLFYPALQDYVIGRVSQMDNGKSNERLERFYTGYDRGGDWVPSWKEQFRQHFDRGAQADSAQTVPLF